MEVNAIQGNALHVGLNVKFVCIPPGFEDRLYRISAIHRDVLSGIGVVELDFTFAAIDDQLVEVQYAKAI